MEFSFKIQPSSRPTDPIDPVDPTDVIQTLVTDDVKLHYYSKLVDLNTLYRGLSRTMILKPAYDTELVSNSIYAMTGTLIHRKNVLLISFGGLMGEFKINKNMQHYSEYVNSYELPEEWYLYIVESPATLQGQ